MKKIVVLFLLPFLLFILSSCYYKELDSDESILMSDNPTKSLLFLENKYGYGEANKFIVKTSNDGKIYIKEGKIYKDELTYMKILEDRNATLIDNINGTLFFVDENGLQGIHYNEEVEIDIPYNYLLNGFNELVKYVGKDLYISLFDNDNNRILKDVLNDNLLYAEEKIESVDNREYTNVIKKDIFIYTNNDEIIYERHQCTKVFNQLDVEISSEESVSKKVIDSNINIKKVIVNESIDSSYTYILTNNNEIIVINNNDLNQKNNRKFTQIQTFKQVDKYIYVIENNTVFVLDSSLNELIKMSFDRQIIGSSWFKEREISYIKIALLEDNNTVILDRIDFPKE